MILHDYPNTKVITSLINNINVHYKDDFINRKKAKRYYKAFEENIIYNSPEESKVRVYGKEYYIARKQVGYGDPGTYYKFAGTTVKAKSWNGDDLVSIILNKIRKKVELFTGKKFNFCLINRYANGDDKIGAHRDDEVELGKDPTIVGVSFGVEREVCFAPYKFIPKDFPNRVKLMLGHGSIFVMHPPTNEYWTHEIPSRKSIKSPRISLTFRQLYIKKN